VVGSSDWLGVIGLDGCVWKCRASRNGGELCESNSATILIERAELNLQSTWKPVQLVPTCIRRDDDFLGLPASRKVHALIRNVAERSSCFAQRIHDCRLDTFRYPTFGTDICNEDAKRSELFSHGIKNYRFALLKCAAFLFGPAPSMPHFFSETTLDRGDVENVVVAAYVFASVFAETCSYWPSRKASSVDYIPVAIFEGE
jgi:hypothetical protein